MSTDARERYARITLSFLADPADAVLGAALRSRTAAEILASLTGDTGHVQLTSEPRTYSLTAAMRRWRSRLVLVPLAARLAAWQESGLTLICPGDPDWPSQLDDLGDARPLLLRARGNPGLRSSCLRSSCLRSSCLRSSCLRSSCLRSSCLRSSCLRSSCLRSSCLRSSCLRSSCLRSSCLRSSCLRSSCLRSSCLRSVSIVGARDATAYGQSTSVQISASLAKRGFTVIAGGAFGIDASAHRGALAAGGLTVAVLAGGLSYGYPRAHQAMFAAIAATGVLVSESPPGRAPARSDFLARNRIIAALSRGTVVVEAALRSGTLNTAGHALELGRTVMAVPGPVTSAQSAGCHELIRHGATCLTSARDVLAHVEPAADVS